MKPAPRGCARTRRDPALPPKSPPPCFRPCRRKGPRRFRRSPAARKNRHRHLPGRGAEPANGVRSRVRA